MKSVLNVVAAGLFVFSWRRKSAFAAICVVWLIGLNTSVSAGSISAFNTTSSWPIPREAYVFNKRDFGEDNPVCRRLSTALQEIDVSYLSFVLLPPEVREYLGFSGIYGVTVDTKIVLDHLRDTEMNFLKWEPVPEAVRESIFLDIVSPLKRYYEGVLRTWPTGRRYEFANGYRTAPVKPTIHQAKIPGGNYVFYNFDEDNFLNEASGGRQITPFFDGTSIGSIGISFAQFFEGPLVILLSFSNPHPQKSILTNLYVWEFDPRRVPGEFPDSTDTGPPRKITSTPGPLQQGALCGIAISMKPGTPLPAK